MSEQTGSGCVEPAKGPIAAPGEQSRGGDHVGPASVITARVGQPAPDFEASAVVKGAFKNIRLSDYRGKWVVLCFYPGDFTFV